MRRLILLLGWLVTPGALGSEMAAQEVTSSSAALLACDQFYYPNACFAFTYQRTVELLEDCGIPVRILKPDEAANPSILNTTRHPVLVNIYGDAYPELAAENLIAYHRSGGCVVSNGVPFGFACRCTKDGWEGFYLPEEKSLRWHSGMGTGLWKRIDHGQRVLYHPEADLLGIDFLPYGRLEFSTLYGLDPDSLPQEDVVHGIVEAEAGTGRAWAVAVIEHHCPAFDGAVDVWAGSHLFSDPRLFKIAAQEQLLIRACAYLLERRGVLTPDEREAISRRARSRWETFPREPRPPPFPRGEGGISNWPAERGIVPRSSEPAPRVSVIDLRGSDPDLCTTVLSLAGLVNRSQPRLYCVLDDADVRWLEELSSEGKFPGGIESLTPTQALEQFSSAYRGAVIPPSTEDLYCGIHAAIAFSAVRELVIASPEVVEEYGLRVGQDLRGRWKTVGEAYAWIREYLYPHMNQNAAALISPRKHEMIDYLVAQRILPFWITGPRDAVEPGADTITEIAFASSILAGMPPNTPVLGFGHHGRYVGIGESEGVELVSRYGKFQMVTGRTANLSLHTGFPSPRLRQKRKPPPPFDPAKVYVAVVMSDGDNLNYWRDRFPKLFDDPARGTFPMGWSIGPSGIDLEPAFYESIYERATENDCFVAAVSGLAYIYPEIYGSAYPQPREIREGFLELTRDRMEAMDVRMVHIHHHGPYGDTSIRTLEHYAEVLSRRGEERLVGLAVGYDRREYVNTLEDAASFLEGGVPVFRSMVPGRVATLVSDIREFVGEQRPAFVCAVTRPWRFKPSQFKEEFDSLGEDYVLVTPEQLATLFRRHGRNPQLGEEHPQSP